MGSIVSLNSIKSRFSQVKLEPKQLSNLKKYIESLSLPGILSGNFQNFFDALDFHIKQPSAPITSARIFSLIKSNFNAEQIPFVVDFLASAQIIDSKDLNLDSDESRRHYYASLDRSGFNRGNSRSVSKKYNQEDGGFSFVEINSPYFNPFSLQETCNSVVADEICRQLSNQLSINTTQKQYDFTFDLSVLDNLSNNKKKKWAQKTLFELIIDLLDKRTKDYSVIKKFLFDHKNYHENSSGFFVRYQDFFSQRGFLKVEDKIEYLKNNFQSFFENYLKANLNNAINVYEELESHYQFNDNIFSILNRGFSKIHNLNKTISFFRLLDLGDNLLVYSRGNYVFLPIDEDDETNLNNLENLCREQLNSRRSNLSFKKSNNKTSYHYGAEYIATSISKLYLKGYVVFSKSILDQIKNPKEFYETHIKPNLYSTNSKIKAENLARSLALVADPKDYCSVDVFLFKSRLDNDDDDRPKICPQPPPNVKKENSSYSLAS